LQFLESRSAGDVWALWQLWLSLGFEALPLAWSRSRTDIDVLACLRLMVFNRLCDPSSKLGVLRWMDTVAWPRGFGFESSTPDHQTLLRAMDVLDEHSQAIKQRMATLMRPLIDQELNVVFYDLTTIRVEGHSEDPDDPRRQGMSKEGVVAHQVMLSLVQTADGLPIAHDVHPGNTAESATLMPMIRELLERWPLKRVVLVADRGLLSLSNLAQIEELQTQLDKDGRGVRLQYVLAVPAARYSEFLGPMEPLLARQQEAQPWVGETLWQPDKSSERKLRVVIAHDPVVAQRRTQERRREIEELVQLGEQWGGRLEQQEAGTKRRGRPLSDSGAKARMYHVIKEARLGHLIKVNLKEELFSFDVDEERQQELERLDGKLIVVTNTDDAPADVVARYKSLADIERGFRTLKSEIEIGPIYHRLPRRIRAHALVCFLALVLHRVLRMRLRAARRQESPSTLLEQLKRVQQQAASTADGQVVRGVTKMAQEQKDLFAAIEVPTPKAQELLGAGETGAL
jgi:transposase